MLKRKSDMEDPAMTELEIMQRAKMYMDKLAQGIDPISDQEVPGDSVLNNVRLVRCFFYVSDVLEQVIANGGKVISGQAEFFITPEELQRVKSVPEDIRISRFAELITETVNDPGRKPLKATTITNWLLEKGYLSKKVDADGKSRRFPTEAGLQLGLALRMTEGQRGAYQVVCYSTKAQQFILDHLLEILQGETKTEYLTAAGKG